MLIALINFCNTKVSQFWIYIIIVIEIKKQVHILGTCARFEYLHFAVKLSRVNVDYIFNDLITERCICVCIFKTVIRF